LRNILKEIDRKETVKVFDSKNSYAYSINIFVKDKNDFFGTVTEGSININEKGREFLRFFGIKFNNVPRFEIGPFLLYSSYFNFVIKASKDEKYDADSIKKLFVIKNVKDFIGESENNVEGLHWQEDIFIQDITFPGEYNYIHDYYKTLWKKTKIM